MRTWYPKTVALLAVAILALWLPSPATGQTVDFPYMDEPGWVFAIPESAGMGPDPSYAASDYAAAVYEAAAYYGISGDWLYATMMCESGGDHSTVGPNGERGVMQYHPYGMWPEMAWAGPIEQIWHAAAQFAAGLSYHWVCA